jgi:hypothetical protein
MVKNVFGGNKHKSQAKKDNTKNVFTKTKKVPALQLSAYVAAAINN